MSLQTTQVSLPNGISFRPTALAGCTSVTDGLRSTESRTCVITRTTAPLVTELLQLPVPANRTAYRHISEMLTYRTVGSGGH